MVHKTCPTCFRWRSMVNCITLNSTSRVVLASCRNAFTMVSFLLYSVVSTFKCNFFTVPSTVLFFLCLSKVANLSLFAIAFIVFNTKTGKTHADIQNQVKQIVSYLLVYSFLVWVLQLPFFFLPVNEQYRWIAYFSIFIGWCFVGIFLLGTKEPRCAKSFFTYLQFSSGLMDFVLSFTFFYNQTQNLYSIKY